MSEGRDETGRDARPSDGSNERGPKPAGVNDDMPGVPGFRTWRGVYWFVFAWFAAVVAALTIFSWIYA